MRATREAFGRGEIVFLYPSNRKILAYVRQIGDDRILCVANPVSYTHLTLPTICSV